MPPGGTLTGLRRDGQILLRDLRVDRRGLHVPVPQVLLDGSKIPLGAPEKLRAAGMPERMRMQEWESGNWTGIP